MANTIREKELRTDWPFTSGLTGTTSQKGHVMSLVAEDESLVPEEEKKGIDY